MSGKAVSSVPRVTADPRLPAQNLSTAAVAPARHEEIVGAQAYFDARLDSALLLASRKCAHEPRELFVKRCPVCGDAASRLLRSGTITAYTCRNCGAEWLHRRRDAHRRRMVSGALLPVATVSTRDAEAASVLTIERATE